MVVVERVQLFSVWVSLLGALGLLVLWLRAEGWALAVTAVSGLLARAGVEWKVAARLRAGCRLVDTGLGSLEDPVWVRDVRGVGVQVERVLADFARSH